MNYFVKILVYTKLFHTMLFLHIFKSKLVYSFQEIVIFARAKRDKFSENKCLHFIQTNPVIGQCYDPTSSLNVAKFNYHNLSKEQTS